MLAILTIVVTVLIGIVIHHYIQRKNYPPDWQNAFNSCIGPYCFPLIGNIPQFVAAEGGIHKLFLSWKSKYGPMFSVHFGLFRAIVLNDVELIREAWNIQQFTGRIQIPKVILRSSDGNGGPTRGVLFTHGKHWTEQRLFMMKHLRKYGSEKLDEIILPEAEEVIQNIEKYEGIPISTAQMYNPAMINVVRKIVSGDRFSHNDPNLTQVMDAITSMLQDKSVDTFVSYLPQWIIEKFPAFSGWNKFRESVNIPKKYFFDMVEKKLEEYQEGNHSDDFINSYISYMNSITDADSSFYKEVGKENLVHMILDFYDAGVETTSTVMCWLLLFMALYPHVQEKIYNEIVMIVGNAPVSLSFRPRMLYTEAIIQETLRKSSAVPLALFHRALEQVNFNGFNIPKDTILISNLYGIHHDPEVWGIDAEQFKPERFLEPSNYKNLKIPFGCGKRICTGENLAKAELFLLTVVTLQRFIVSIDQNSPCPTTEQEVGGIIAPPLPHKLIFQLR